MRQAADRLSILWYPGYDLGEQLPDHSSLTRIHERYGVDIFRRFFEAIVEQCLQAGLVWGKELYIEGAKVQANASKDSLKPRFYVEAHLDSLFGEAREETAESAEQESHQQTCLEEAAGSQPAEEGAAVSKQLPASIPQELQEELCRQNTERHDWIEQLGAQDRRVTSRGYQRMADYLVSTTDLDATLMETKNGTAMGYRTHYVVDGGKSRIILQVLVTPSEVMDNQPMRDLVFCTCFRWKLRPRHVTGDTKYGTTDNIVALEREHIHAHVPIADLAQRTPLFRQEDFQYDAQRDVYVCPAGKELHFCQRQTTERSRHYRARAKDCNPCPLKANCTTSKQGRSLRRSVDETYLDRVRAYHHTEAYKNWTKSQTLTEKAKLGTPSVPSRGLVCLLFCSMGPAFPSLGLFTVWFFTDRDGHFTGGCLITSYSLALQKGLFQHSKSLYGTFSWE